MNWVSMNGDQALRWAIWFWTVFLAVWLVMGLRIKRAKQRETSRERMQHLIPVFLGFWLLLGRNWGVPDALGVPDTPSVPWLGLLLTAMGVALSIWARVSLGANWSGTVTLKDDHELISKGLYRWIRHPIYTGILLAMIGTALIRGHLRGWVGFLIVLAAFYFKARREEGFLRQEFGDGFEEHARRTGMFLPKWI